MKKTINEILVDFMNLLEIKYCFGIPGSNMSLLDEINKNKKINLILTKHEESAGFMASGYTKSTGKISSCFGSVGPGATNLITSVASAYYDSQPILILSGQVKQDFWGRNAFQESTGKKQTISQLNLFKEITSYSVILKSEKYLKTILETAYQKLTSEKPGPVYIEIPVNIMDRKVNIPRNFFSFKKFIVPKDKKLNYKIRFSAIQLGNAKNPLILVGAGGLKFGKEIKEIAKKLSCPIVTTLKGRGVISEKDKYSLGTIGITGQKGANEFLNSNVDYLLVIGSSLGQFTTNHWESKIKESKIIRIDIHNPNVTNNFKEYLALKGDIKKIINKLNYNLKIKKKKSFRDYKIEYDAKSLQKKNNIHPAYFTKLLRDNLPKDSIICTEQIAWVEKYFKIYKPRTQIACTGFAPIGCSLAESIGVKFGNKNKVVVSFQGDGGFNMSGLEIMTAKNYNLSILFIVLDNEVLGPIYQAQKKKYKSSFMTEFKNPSFSNLAKGFGIQSITIKNKNNIKPLIKKALTHIQKGNSVLLNVKVDKNAKW